MKVTRLDVRSLTGSDVLYGEGRGRKACRTFIDRTPREQKTLRVALDFKGIEHASASFLREAVLGFFGYLRVLDRPVYPFVANMNTEVEEELSLVLNVRGDCVVSAPLSSNDRIGPVKVLGLSDGKHLRTLSVLLNGIEVSVGEIRSRLPEDNRPAGTALNGRLEWLCGRGLLASRQEGREKKYRFPFTGE